MCNSCLFVLQFSFSVLFNLNVCVYMDFIHQLITNEVADDRVSSIYVYIHCFTLQSFTAKQFSLIIDQPRLLGLMLPLLSKFWHKWERLYWIIQRSRPFVIYIYCVCLFCYSNFFFYLHTDDVIILSSFFLSSNFFSAFSLMKSWLTRMNSLQSFLFIVTLQWNLYRKSWNVSVVTCLIVAWLFILRTINALILFTDLTKMIYDTLILLR